MDDAEQRILRSWQANAQPWAAAIQAGSIQSRRLVTNAAVIAAATDFRGDALSSIDASGAQGARGSSPALSVLDVGCGEGWLARELAARGFTVLGVDAIPSLVQAARRHGGPAYEECSYEDMAQRRFVQEPVDLAICNFSLLGEQSVQALLTALPHYIKPGGGLIIQTLHPVSACGDQPYQDGWRAGSWAGFSDAFSDPAPWYFRTLESWLRLLNHAAFALEKLNEPTMPGSKQPSSVIFICRRRA